jgi:hypothetical protein
MDTEVMKMGVQAMKHAALLQEWSARIAECRTSGKPVKAWCSEQGIPIKKYYYWEKKFVTEAIQQFNLPAPGQVGLLMRVNPDAMPSSDVADVGSGIIIHHGESVIALPAGSSMEAIADLVKALNRHA